MTRIRIRIRFFHYPGSEQECVFWKILPVSPEGEISIDVIRGGVGECEKEEEKKVGKRKGKGKI